MQLIALHGTDARRYEPKRLRLGLFALWAVSHTRGPQDPLTDPLHWPWARQIIIALTRLHTLAAPT
ncbi:hypothetical protein [Nonomuraea fuscirosea]|uniref:hypothetical protein n=1 Tax=Nonomuraea fuscirosea TaxID=1291556 RepID=UPI0033CA882A